MMGAWRGYGAGGSSDVTEELAALRAAVERSREGVPQVVLVEGEPGIGKSRLVAELAGELTERRHDLASGPWCRLAAGPFPTALSLG